MRNLTSMMDRTTMVRDTAGGLNLNGAASVKMTWNSTVRSPDADSILVDLANNRIQLKETGWYTSWVNVTCASGTAITYQGAVRLFLGGVAFSGTYASQGMIYTPIGILGTSMCIVPFLFENTVADQYLEVHIARTATSSGTINTSAFGSYWGVQFHGS